MIYTRFTMYQAKALHVFLYLALIPLRGSYYYYYYYYDDEDAFSPIYVSLKPASFNFIIQVDLQPADLAVVKKQKSIQFQFLSQAANNKGWGNIFMPTIIVKSSFSLRLPGRAGRQAGSHTIAKARRTLMGMEFFGVFPFQLSSFPILFHCHLLRGPDLLLFFVPKTHFELFPQR